MSRLAHGSLLASALIAIATNGASAAPPAPRALPLPYNMSRFPAAWFGGNDTAFESEASLEALGKYSLAILGWQALLTATNWTASIYAQLAQAAVIKARHPALPVFVYQGRVHAARLALCTPNRIERRPRPSIPRARTLELGYSDRVRRAAGPASAAARPERRNRLRRLHQALPDRAKGKHPAAVKGVGRLGPEARAW